jgi:hypothetical protein
MSFKRLVPAVPRLRARFRAEFRVLYVQYGSCASQKGRDGKQIPFSYISYGYTFPRSWTAHSQRIAQLKCQAYNQRISQGVCHVSVDPLYHFPASPDPSGT